MDVISTEADYERALVEAESYFDDEPQFGTPDSDRFIRLVAMISDYEDKLWTIGAPAHGHDGADTARR